MWFAKGWDGGDTLTGNNRGRLGKVPAAPRRGCGRVSGPMSDLTIEVVTTRSSMEEIRPAIDAGLKEAFPGGMLKWRWEGEVLHLSGPGAKGTVVLEDGRLVGRAYLGPPASMMRPIIEQKIRSVMLKVVA